MPIVAGIDGCRNKWLAVLYDLQSATLTWRVIDNIHELLLLPESPLVIAVDVPIGLLDAADRGGRECDRQAREHLGSPRGNSVFSPPVRSALKCKTYPSALATNRASSPSQIGISKQCYGIFSNIRAADEAMNPQLQSKVYEVHPELCFYELAGGNAMQNRKKNREGKEERRGHLQRAFGDFDSLAADFEAKRPTCAALDDFLDACVACWTATRIFNGEARKIPDPAPLDSRGLRMEMWR